MAPKRETAKNLEAALRLVTPGWDGLKTLQTSTHRGIKPWGMHVWAKLDRPDLLDLVNQVIHIYAEQELVRSDGSLHRLWFFNLRQT